jgi:hypothetical protein
MSHVRGCLLVSLLEMRYLRQQFGVRPSTEYIPFPYGSVDAVYEEEKRLYRRLTEEQRERNREAVLLGCRLMHALNTCMHPLGGGPEELFRDLAAVLKDMGYALIPCRDTEE